MSLFKQKKCLKCGNCCKNYPCNILPNDLAKISNFLNISIDELIEKYLIIDYYCYYNSLGYFFVPKRKTDESNIHIANYSWAFKFTECIFLTKDNLCEIYDSNHNGIKVSCYNDNNYHSKEYYAKVWKDNEYLNKYLAKIENKNKMRFNI